MNCCICGKPMEDEIQHMLDVHNTYCVGVYHTGDHCTKECFQ